VGEQSVIYLCDFHKLTMAMMMTSGAATKALQQELKSLQKEPLEGFTVKLVDDNIFEWEVGIFGPPDTLYQGGYFKSAIRFPRDYPYSPPTVKFIGKMWHPNIYENGEVCISILHPPVDDPTNHSELPSEKWNPAQSVRTVMMSIISLLNEPNTCSPANVDASVMYRRYKESKQVDKEYENIIKKQVAATFADAESDDVIVPNTLEEYCKKKSNDNENDDEDYMLNDMDDINDDDFYNYDDDEDEEDEDEDEDEEEEEDEDNDGEKKEVAKEMKKNEEEEDKAKKKSQADSGNEDL